VSVAPGRIAVIAGSGELPVQLAHELAGSGSDLYMAALSGIADETVESELWETGWFEVSKLQGLVDGLLEAGASSLLMAGQVKHSTAISLGDPDALMMGMIASLPDMGSATLLSGVVGVFSQNGLEVMAIPAVAPGMVAGKGLVAGPEPTPELLSDLAFGWPLAKEIARMDIGQSIIVKSRSVVGVEAMEGTDATIRRCGDLPGLSGHTLIKVTAPGHDMRFDIPTIGTGTITALAQTGASALVVEAGKCLILRKDEVISLCDESGITLLSAENGSLEGGS
jgi:DUF1009 family protein